MNIHKKVKTTGWVMAIGLACLVLDRFVMHTSVILTAAFTLIIISALYLLGLYYLEDRKIRKEITEMKEGRKQILEASFWKDSPYYEDLSKEIEAYIESQNRESHIDSYNKEATLTALQSQINPHFLYNTLESIRGQALLDDNREIAVMLEELGNFFRYSISRKETVVTLLEELQNIRGYMFIQNYRFSGRYSLEIEYLTEEEEVDRCMMPKLTLQPIIENTILHAFEKKSRGVITVSIDDSEDRLLITVSDDGSGMDEKTLGELNARIRGQLPARTGTRHTGIALENINNRIHILFGNEYGLCAYSTPGHGTDIEIDLPKLKESDLRKSGQNERDSV